MLRYARCFVCVCCRPFAFNISTRSPYPKRPLFNHVRFFCPGTFTGQVSVHTSGYLLKFIKDIRYATSSKLCWHYLLYWRVLCRQSMRKQGRFSSLHKLSLIFISVMFCFYLAKWDFSTYTDDVGYLFAWRTVQSNVLIIVHFNIAQDELIWFSLKSDCLWYRQS